MKIRFLKIFRFGATVALGVTPFVLVILKYRPANLTVSVFIHRFIVLLLGGFVGLIFLGLVLGCLSAWHNWSQKKAEDWADVHDPGWRGRNT